MNTFLCVGLRTLKGTLKECASRDFLSEYPMMLAQHVQHTRRNFLAHRLEPRVLASFVELGDHGGEGLADAGYLGQPV